MSKKIGDVILDVKNISLRFGGVKALTDISFNVREHEVRAIIGPNGAGKSTLTHLLSGDLPSTSGQIQLGAQDVTGWSADRISHHGLGRSFQKTHIFSPLSVWENIRLAAQSRSTPSPGNPLGWWLRADAHASVNQRAERALQLARLTARRDTVAGLMSHGEQRQLEIAMCLATEPEVLLLDEPLAGMGVAEAERMVELLLALKQDHAMLLVEHDMDAVFTLADRLTVMVNGQVIASGTPAEIRADANVQAAYLGEEHA